MISWIQQRLIRHGRWIFLLLLAVIIVAFVFTIGNTPGCTTNRSAYEEALFYGVDLNSPAQTQLIAEKVSLSAMLNTGRQIQDPQEFQFQLMSRIALLHMADQLGVPSPTQETLAGFIRSKRAFAGPDGNFSPDAYTRFVDNIESNPRIPDGLVVLTLEEDYRVQEMTKALTGPGYVLPSEALAQVQRNETSYTVATAQIEYESFDPEISAETEALQTFYDAEPKRYEISERIKSSYALFTAADYASKVGELDEQSLRSHFIENRARFVQAFEAQRAAKDAAVQEGEESAEEEDAPVTFEDVKDAVSADLSEQAASRLANQAAETFAYTLYRDSIKRDTPAFEALVSESGAKVASIEPFTREDVGSGSLPRAMLEAGFALSEGRYYSDAYPVEGGFAVLLYEGRIAPEIPPFETVKEQVELDYRAEEKRRLFFEEGNRLKEALDAKIAEGTAFTEAAEALDLTAQSFDAFQGKAPPPELNRTAFNQATQMDGGELSPMLQSGGLGVFVFVEQKEVPEIGGDSEELEKNKDFLKNFASFLSRNSVVNEVVSRGLGE